MPVAHHVLFDPRRLLVAGLLVTASVASHAQTIAPAPGPDGSSPGRAPSPEATSASPGSPSGPRSASPGSSTTGYVSVSPGLPSTTTTTPAASRAPETAASSPGTAIAPAEQALRREPLPPQSQLPPSTPQSAIHAPGVAPGTPRLTAPAPRQPAAPVVSPDDQHAPAAENLVPTTASPLVKP